MGSSENVRVTERFTRVSPTTLTHEVTFNDPSTWTKPWTLMIPLKHVDEKMYEYACHEGNTGLEGLLAEDATRRILEVGHGLAPSSR